MKKTIKPLKPRGKPIPPGMVHRDRKKDFSRAASKEDFAKSMENDLDITKKAEVSE